MTDTPEQDAQVINPAEHDLLVCIKTENQQVRMRIAAATQFGPEDADNPSVIVATWLVQNWPAVVNLATTARIAARQAQAAVPETAAH